MSPYLISTSTMFKVPNLTGSIQIFLVRLTVQEKVQCHSCMQQNQCRCTFATLVSRHPLPSVLHLNLARDVHRHISELVL